jgi:hypothetical protein
MRTKSILMMFLIAVLLLSTIWLFTQDFQTRDVIKTEGGDYEDPSDRLAIIVGVEDYKYIRDLNYTIEDAEAIKSVLENQGAFDVEFMTTEKGRKPTRENILQILNDTLMLAKMNDVKTLIFYFGGHGFEVNGKNYMAVEETNPKDIERTGLKLDEVLGILDDIKKEAKVMVFIDACRNDPYKSKTGDTSTDGSDTTLLYGTGLQSDDGFSSWDDISSTGFKVLYSTSEEQYSYELPDMEHGLFSLYLSEALSGEADTFAGDGNGYVTFNEAAKYTYIKMKYWSDENPKYKQIPRIDMKEAIGDFFITMSNSEETEKPGLSMSLMGWKSGISKDWFSLNEGGTLRSGDVYKLKLQSDEEYYIYIFQVDSSNAIYSLFPWPNIKVKNPIPPFQTVYIPKETNIGYELDDIRGEETIYVYATKEKNKKLAYLADFLYEDDNWGNYSFDDVKSILEEATVKFKDRGPKKKLKDVSPDKDGDGHSIHESEKFLDIGDGRIIKFTFNHD